MATGATRRAERGIAVELGVAGATVYCTGRSVRGEASPSDRPETFDETAEMVTARGGVGIPVRVDHTVPAQVEALFERVQSEQSGRLNILVNNVWGGDALTEWDKPFWEHSLNNGLRLLEQALHSHLIATHFVAPLLLAAGSGLIVTTVDSEYGPLYWNLAKNGAERMTQLMAKDMRPHHVAVIALGPDYMRTERMLDDLAGADYRTQPEAHVRASESTFYAGRALGALASDPDILRKTGTGIHTGNAAEDYGFTDVDGSRSHWEKFWKETHPE